MRRMWRSPTEKTAFDEAHLKDKDSQGRMETSNVANASEENVEISNIGNCI